MQIKVIIVFIIHPKPKLRILWKENCLLKFLPHNKNLNEKKSLIDGWELGEWGQVSCKKQFIINISHILQNRK